MFLRYLLDTNICMYTIRHKPATVRARLEALEPGTVAMSVITYGELYSGAVKSVVREATQRKLEELASLLPLLSLPPACAQRYGTICATLESAGRPIGGNDLWIAAHARASRWSRITNANSGACRDCPWKTGRSENAIEGNFSEGAPAHDRGRPGAGWRGADRG